MGLRHCASRATEGSATLILIVTALVRAAAAEDDLPELPEIVVTAERVERNVRLVPMSVTAVTSGEIEDAGIADLGDLSGEVPDLTVVDWGSRRNTFLYVRGIGSSRQGESAVGVYVDDVPLLSNGTFMTDLSGIERIEVLRGPQGTLFGRNTLGGVLNIITKDLPAEPGGSVGFSFGTDDVLELRGAFAGPLGRETLRLGLSAFGSSRDGYTVNDLTGDTVDDREATGGRLKLAWLPSDALEVTFGIDAESDRDGGYALTPLADVRSNPYHLMHDYEGYENRNVLGASIRINYAMPRAELTSVSAFRTWDLDFAVDQDFTAFDIMRSNWTEDQKQFTQELRLASREDAGAPRWLLGAAYFSEDSSDDRITDYGALAATIPLPFTRVAGDRDVSAADYENSGVALFGNVVWPAGDRLELSGGLRWDREEKSIDLDEYQVGSEVSSNSLVRSDDFDEIVPRAGLSFKVSEEATAYLNIARGYRSGGFNGTAMVPADETYGPEHSMNYEVGLKASSSDRRTGIDVAAFYITWDDQQVVQYLPSLDTVTRNAGESRSVGAEAEVAFRPRAGVEITAGLSYVDAEFVDYDDPIVPASYDGNKIPMAKEYDVSLAAKFRRTIRGDARLFARLALRAQGEFFWEPANAFREEPHQFVDLRVGLEHGKWDVTLWAKNLFDEDYASMVIAQGPLAVGQAGDPRTVGLSVKARF